MIEKEQSISIARERAKQNGWAFAEPLEVVVRRGWLGGVSRFEIETNAGIRGTKARFTIDAKTGEILSEGYVPR
jgi:hypothetical protein